MEIISYKDAKNAYYARYLIMQQYANETYFLQLDSHMRFDLHWDTRNIDMLHNCDAREKSIITVYPPAYSIKDLEDGWEVDFGH